MPILLAVVLLNLEQVCRYILGVQTFYHPTLNYDRVRVRNETINHIRVGIRIRVIDSSPLAISLCYKVYAIRFLVIKCRVIKCR